MKALKILAPGPLKHKFYASALEYYHKLIANYIPCEILLPRAKGKSLTTNEVLKKEEEILLKTIETRKGSSSYLIALDQKGKSCTTGEFANLFQKLLTNFQEIWFIVGGAEGLSLKIKEQANFILSLSQLTFNHELALVVLAETLFRTLSLLKGHPYHR